MPMLRFLFRKMWNTRWLTFSTFVGLIVAVAFTTSIPMYADGALKRVIASSLQQENQSGWPPGSLMIRYQVVGSERVDLEDYNEVNQYIQQQIPADIGFPIDSFVRSQSIRGTSVTPADPSQVDPSQRRQMTLSSLSNLPDHIDITGGTVFSNQPQNGQLEALMYEEALFRNDLRVGDVIRYPVSGGNGIPPLEIKIVGSFQPSETSPAYWYQGMEGFLNTLLIDETLFNTELINRNVPLSMANWYYAFDLREIQTSQIPGLERKLERLEINLYQLLKDTRVDVSFLDLLAEFKRQSTQLQFLLFTLAAPMIAMVFYYIVMNSRQALDRQRNDIAVLRSRGASTGQIIRIFLLEGFLLGGIALITGTLLGWFMAKSIGSSSGFLTFVDRKSVPVGFGTEMWLYGLIAVLIAIVASLIPAITYARASIVTHKQSLARSDRKPVWQRWFLDIALLGVVGYGWYLFQQRQFLSMQTGLTTDQLQVQPLLFFVPAIAIFSLGLFFLRVFPWLLRFIGWIGKRFLSVSSYLTLTQLSRSSASYYPLMLLLMLTLGLGVYNSSAARTIDLNSTERTLYEYGTDVVIQTAWDSVSDDMPTNPNPGGGGGQPGGQPGGGGGGQPGGGGGGGQPGGNPGGPGSNPGESGPRSTRFIEPPFEFYRDLEGVEHAARVMQARASATISGRTAGQGTVVGIDNDQFYHVAWFRDDLVPGAARFHQYLNQLGLFEQAVLIPTNFAERYQLGVGDILTLSIQQQAIEFVVVGVLPYWPAQYPEESPFFITNLEFIYDQAAILPYEVWLKMEDGARVAPLLEELAARNMEVASVKDVRNELISQGRHPSRGGVFGILSLGFLVSVLISLIGYLLFWFFNLSGRVVQFGVLRAMGLKRRQLTIMLLMEQIFTAGLAIALGVGIGKATSYLFLPFLQTADSVQTQVPPFRVVFEARDTNQLYIVVAFMMLTGAALLLLHIRRLKVHQAVKMGEER